MSQHTAQAPELPSAVVHIVPMPALTEKVQAVLACNTIRWAKPRLQRSLRDRMLADPTLESKILDAVFTPLT